MMKTTPGSSRCHAVPRLIVWVALCAALPWQCNGKSVALEIRPHGGTWCATYTNASLLGSGESLFELRLTSEAEVDTKFILIERDTPEGVETSYYLEGWDEITSDVRSDEGWTSWVFSPGEVALMHLRVWAPAGTESNGVLRICAFPVVGDCAGGREGPGTPGDCDAYGYGILAGGEFEWLGTGTTYLVGATAHANGAMKITGSNRFQGTVTSSVRIWSTGSSDIEGDAKAPEFKGKTPGNVTGTATLGEVPVVELPELDLAPYHAAALAIGEVYDGEKHFSGASDIRPAGGIMWVNGDLRISGSGDMYGCFIATGDIRISGSGDQYKVECYPALISRDGDIDITGNSEFHGLIYAMNGEFRKSGNGRVVGSILCRKDFKKSGSWTGLIYEHSVPSPPSCGSGNTDTGGDTVLCNVPPLTAWAIANGSSQLCKYALEQGGEVHVEGTVTGVDGTLDVEALTVAGDGTIYIVNNALVSTIYAIPPSTIDGNPTTPVQCTQLVKTGLSAGSGNNEITALQMIGGTLYAFGKKSKAIYAISTSTGTMTDAGTLNVSGAFTTYGATLGADRAVYIVKTQASNSQVWKFTVFPDGELVKICTVPGSGEIKGLAGHPDGHLYATDNEKWFRINPATGTSEVVADAPSDLEDMDFYYVSEQQDQAVIDVTVTEEEEEGGDDDDDDDGAKGSKRPDLEIAVRGGTFVGAGPQPGNGAAPDVTGQGNTRTEVEYVVRVTNTGDETTAFVVTEKTASHSHWIVRYFDAVDDGTEISNALRGAGWTTPVLANGESTSLLVTVVPGAVENALTLTLQARAASDAAGGNGPKEVITALTTKLAAGSAVRIREWHELRE